MLVILNVDWLIRYAGSLITVIVFVINFAAVVVVAIVITVAVYGNFDIFQGFF